MPDSNQTNQSDAVSLLQTSAANTPHDLGTFDGSRVERANDAGDQSLLAAVQKINSSTLLAGRDELMIDHHGVIYRLRQTALGKLILTK
jgi:hemin uptake protein HemP